MSALDRAHDLGALADAAVAEGLDLDVPVASVLDELELSVRARVLLDRWLDLVPALTVGDLLRTRRRPVRMELAVQRQLFGVLRDWLRRGRPRKAPAPTSEHALPARPTAADLDAWAARYETAFYVAATLERLAEYAPPQLAGELGWRGWVDARTALLPPTPGQRGLVNQRLTDGVRTVLERIAGQVAAAIAEEAGPPRGPVADPRLEPFAQVLGSLRAGLRRDTHPVGRALRSSFRVSVEGDPPALCVEARPSVVCALTSKVVVRLPLEHRADEVPQLRCGCPRAPVACPARLGAVDRALDVLSDPSEPACAAVLRELAIPAWVRAIARLETTVLPQPAAGTIGWRVEGRSGSWRVAPVTFRPAKSGSGTVVSRVNEFDVQELGDERDQRVLDELNVARMQRARTGASERAEGRALRSLIGHPHVFLGKRPVTVVEEPFDVVLDGGDDGVRVGVRHGGAVDSPRAFLDALDVSPSGGVGVRVDEERGLIVLVPLLAPVFRALQSLALGPSEFPAEAVEPWLKLADRWRGRVPVALGGGLRGESLAPSDRVEVRLGAPAPGMLRAAFRVRHLPGGEAQAPAQGPTELFGVVDGRRVFVTRDLDAERALHAAAWEGLPGEPAADVDVVDPEVALAWLERLPAVAGIEVTWDAKRWRVGAALSASNLRLRGRDARSWFAIDGSLEVEEGVVPLSTLLAAVRERRVYVPVGADRWARLTDALRAQVESLARGQAPGEGLEVSPVQLPLLDALLRDGAQLDGSVGMMRLLERLRAADTDHVVPPTGVRGVLRPYQLEGHRFLARLARWAPGAFLADDMGLGKTIQALALLIDRAGEGPALVVAPTSVGFNWVREAERFAPSLRVSPWRGADRRARLSGLRAGDVIVTSYDLVQRDAAALAEVPFATVVLDEAQAAKNSATRRWKAIAGLRRGFTLALTGTPIENRLDELWALAALVVPGLFGDLRHFRDTWATPVERGADDQVRRALSLRIRPFLLRRTKAAVAPELPERTLIDVVVPLEADEQQLYEQVRQGALVELEAHPDESGPQTRIRVLAALTALRRVACYPGLHDPSWSGSTSKLTRVRELVAELRAEGHKALLFSQFVGHLAKVRAALEEDGVAVRYLDGSTPEAARRGEVDAFQRGEGDVFLISLKAGGTGLNLTAATYVLHLDPWWNPAVEDQATDRAHRIGQTRAVTVYRVVAAGTVEEQILRLHEDKRRLVAGVLEGTDAGARLGTDDLMALLRGEEPAPRAASPAPPAPPGPRSGAAEAPPESPRWTTDRVRQAIERDLDADVAAGRIAASSAGVYRYGLRKLLSHPGADAALVGAAAFTAFVAENAKPGPIRAVGARVARLIDAGG